MKEYDYRAELTYHAELMPELEGKTLKCIRVHIVEPEFNVLYLQTDGGVYAILGEIGSEILGIRRVAELPELIKADTHAIQEFPPFACFLGKRIKQVRMIGQPWNGHGFEISFETLPGKTMIIQSIYAGEKPKDFEDCIRLGVGYYYWDSAQAIEEKAMIRKPQSHP